MKRAVIAGSVLAPFVGAAALYFADNEPSAPAPVPLVQMEEPADPICAATEQPMPLWRCETVGLLRFTFWSNLQPAVQFCRWRDANPGEWARINTYTTTGTRSEPIVTWKGAALATVVQAYFAVGGTPFTIAPNTVPNSCGKGKLVSPPTDLKVVG